MLVKKLLLSALILSCVWIFSCTDLSGSTSLGQDIVNDVDPNRTDFLKNFSFSDSAKPIAEFSLAAPNDTVIGYNSESSGTIKSGSTPNREARGMVAFIIDTNYLINHSKDTVKSILLQFSSDDSVSKIPDSLVIYDYNRFPLTNTDSLTITKAVATLNRSYDSTSKNWLFKGYLNSTSSDIASFSSSLRAVPKDTLFLRYLIINYKNTYTDTIFRLNSVAKMTIQFKRDTLFTETISSKYSNSVVFDKSTKADSLSKQPITSSETGRKAVFAFDMTKLWNSMDTSKGFNKIHSATLTIKDSILPGFDTTKTIPFRYYISPILFTDANELRDSISKSGTSSEMGTADSIALPAVKFIRNYFSSKPKTLYLYINNSNNNTARQETLWLKPSLTAVFTNNQ